MAGQIKFYHDISCLCGIMPYPRKHSDISQCGRLINPINDLSAEYIPDLGCPYSKLRRPKKSWNFSTIWSFEQGQVAALERDDRVDELLECLVESQQGSGFQGDRELRNSTWQHEQ
jgi:hypothetical protein